MIAPPPAFSRCGIAAWQAATTERTLRSKILSISSSERSSNGVRLISEPALLTSTSRPPSACAAVSTTRLGSPRLREVAVDEQACTAASADGRGHRLGFLAAARIEVQRDSRARLGKCLAAAAPDAGAAAGDENALSGKIVEHGGNP